MRCKRADHLLERYLDGTLKEGLSRRVRLHIEGCPRCAAAAGIASGIAGRLSETGRIGAAPPGLALRIMAEIAREPLPGRSPDEASRDSSGMVAAYRRAGFSFIVTALVLAASLLVPRGGYPSLVDSRQLAADLGKGRPAAVMDLFRSADGIVAGLTAPEGRQETLR